VLYGSDPHHRARLFAFIAKLRGWSVQAFDNFEEAVTWLSGAGSDPSETETEYHPGVKEVPVRTLQSLGAAARPASPPSIPIKSSAGSKQAAVQARAGKKPAPSARTDLTGLAIGLLTALSWQL
jgi:hypothetical protein